MAITFPTTLDSLTNPTSVNNLNTSGVLHADQHSDLNDAVEALEAKVGIDSSLVTTSLDYILKNASSVSPGHKHNGSDFRSSNIASLPSASSAGAGAVYRVTDLAGGSAFVYSDGTYWRPLGGFMTLESGAGTSYTGGITEQQLKAVTIPAKLMAPNTSLIILTLFEMTNNANNKRLRVRFGGSGGTAYYDGTIASFANTRILTIISNIGAVNSQLGGPNTLTGLGTSGLTNVTSTVDTGAADTTLYTSVQLSTGTDTVSVKHQLVLLATV